MTTRRIRYFAASERERIERRLRASVTNWSQDWFVRPACAVESVIFGPEATISHAALFRRSGEGGVIAANFGPFPLEAFLGRDGLAPRSPGSVRLETELTRMAVIDLVEAFVGPTVEGEASHAQPKGNGCEVKIDVGGRTLVVSLNGACFPLERGRLGEGEPLTRVGSALKELQERTSFELVVGEAQLPLPELMRLEPGDVVKLTTPLEGTVRLIHRRSKAEIAGYLGNFNGRLAVKTTE